MLRRPSSAVRRPPSAVRRPRSAFYPSAFYLHPIFAKLFALSRELLYGSKSKTLLELKEFLGLFRYVFFSATAYLRELLYVE